MKVNREALWKMIGYEPHEGQSRILDGLKRFTVVMAGRQFGKSKFVSSILIEELLKKNKKIWIVAPNYNLTERIFREYLLPIIEKYKNDFKFSLSDMRIVCPSTGSSIECKSAENPVSLLGATLDMLVIDEAAEIASEVYERYLRPTLMVKKGNAIFISTPTNRSNWFFQLWANKEENKDIASFHFTSYDNPYIPTEELEEIKARTPEAIWRNQYMAEPLDDGGSVFTGVRAAIGGELQEQGTNDTGRYILGWDVARVHDYSVVTVIDRKTRGVVYYDRFSGIEWSLQIERVLSAAHKFSNASIIMDANAQGDPLCEQLRTRIFEEDYPIYVNPYKTDSNEAKKRLIENLAVMIQNWEISYPDIKQLISELEQYTYIYSQYGNVKYTAPKGLFDDSVISLALCCWELRNNPNYEGMYHIDTGRRRERDEEIPIVKIY